MMKRIFIAFFSIAAAFALVISCIGERHATGTVNMLKDGVYTASTAPDGENYFCRGIMKVEKGAIVSIEWEIRDKNRNDRLFDATYGPEVYPNQEFYRSQCRENLEGMKAYGPRLIETQDPIKVDAVTGATWAYGKFSQVVKALLKKARKEPR